MEKEKTIHILCPCCNTEIVVDIGSGRVLYHDEKKEEKGSSKKKSIQELLKEMETQKQKTSSRFEEEKEALKNRSEMLEKKFEEIKKHVDTSEETRPPHPFDYD
jgi:uncharacterized Zn finger protein (UPF0148 family)